MKKEKNMWLGITGIIVSLLGLVVSFFHISYYSGLILIGIGLIFSIIGVVLNWHRRGWLAIIGLVVSLGMINSALVIHSLGGLNNYIESGDSNYDHPSYDDDDDEDYDDETTAADLKQVKVGDEVTIDGVQLKINSVQDTDNDYLAINVTMKNNTKHTVDFDYNDFEVAATDDDDVMSGIYNSLAQDDLGEDKFNYVDLDDVSSGQSDDGDLLFDKKDGNAKYLVFSMDGTRKVAMKLY
ncbi:DUF4352 domain-containing protein [Weissella coleopterorum]|uniref:DUF4352 domain-containing protein n=1 Tax=Weissella coleopterorum TaxID=2714949 RepID=A0A6G8AZD2_9LACO|nr:DUF4352 domain-containing protein [Weissella coleopterorum]QIL50366.1 DUF4352 domain-containing protein [Weissella coleopterorum]